MEGRCTECNCHNVALHHYHTNLCYNCYEKMYYMPNPFEDNKEPDFELENETATVTPAGSVFFMKDGEKIHLVPSTSNNTLKLYANSLTLTNPKQYKLNPDCRYGLDVEKLIKFLLDNMTIYENAKGFEQVSYMFKEVE